MSESRAHSGFAYIGCYTPHMGGEGAGITLARRAPSGGLRDAVLAAETAAPSFLVRHPSRAVLYAVNELTDDGGLTAFEMAPGGGLTALGSWSTGGALPCHLAVGDGHLYVANYGSGSIAVFPLDAAGVPTGRTDLVAHSGRGPDEQRQAGPHAHMVSPFDGVLFVVDLGLDRIYSYGLDAGSGRLRRPELAAALTPGTGPRHLVRHGDGVHVVGELEPSVVSYDVAGGGWQEISRVPTSGEAGPVQPSEIGISPDGRFLYVANRGVDTVAVFALRSGLPERVAEVPAGGAWPRHLVVVDDVLYVANERSHTVATFRIDPATGSPTPAGELLRTPSPTCVLPVALG